MWDLFISYASEDKEIIARPLANSLTNMGLKVWYDEFNLKLGDSLRRKIDEGLSKSRFGLVILSHHFFNKEWPQKELDGLTSREINGNKVILPIWHEITKEDVLNYSPILADKVALSSTIGIHELAKKIFNVVHNERGIVDDREQNTPNKLICDFSYKKIRISQNFHSYHLIITIKNVSDSEIEHFKLLFLFPIACVSNINGIKKAKDVIREKAVDYWQFEYIHDVRIYPSEEAFVLSDSGPNILEYHMTHDLYFTFLDNPPYIKWKIYLPKSKPSEGEKPFIALHNF